MRTTKLIIALLITGGAISSCVERYYSDFETNFTPQLVVEANLCPDEGVQQIVVSTSSSPNDPVFTPLAGCAVQVEDDQGNIFPFTDPSATGHYRGTIDNAKVIIGSSYRLRLQTPDNRQYSSSYEQLLPCPPIDSLYFILETKPTNDPAIKLNGLQFMMDFKADDSYGPYYRLELVETYEYHAEYPLSRWQDQNGFGHILPAPDYSNMVCYKTTTLRNLFNLSTEGFSQNSYRGFQLHFVKDQSPPLKIRYSLLLNQYSMDKKAYFYWENLRKNNQEATDLFGKQPAVMKGNIVNVNDSTDKALGYFGVSSLHSRRIMVRPMAGLSFDKAYYCKAKKALVYPKQSVVYFADDFDENGDFYRGIVSDECIFCQLLGGTTLKPPYWEEP